LSKTSVYHIFRELQGVEKNFLNFYEKNILNFWF